MKLLCRLGWHEYTKWEYEGILVIKTFDAMAPSLPPENKQYEVQARECVHCGIKKMRRQRR
jgi:hypothetical protein